MATNGGFSAIGESTVNLAKSPLGVLALFVILSEAIFALVLTNAQELHVALQTLLVLFMCFFPTLLVGMFWNLVVYHNLKLYAPSEFPNHADFLEANQVSTADALRKMKADILAEIEGVGAEASVRVSAGTISQQADAYIAASEILATKRFTKAEIEELRQVVASAEDESETEVAIKSAKLSKWAAAIGAGAAGAASSTVAISEVLRALTRLL